MKTAVYENYKPADTLSASGIYVGILQVKCSLGWSAYVLLINYIKDSKYPLSSNNPHSQIVHRKTLVLSQPH